MMTIDFQIEPRVSPAEGSNTIEHWLLVRVQRRARPLRGEIVFRSSPIARVPDALLQDDEAIAQWVADVLSTVLQPALTP